MYVSMYFTRMYVSTMSSTKLSDWPTRIYLLHKGTVSETLDILQTNHYKFWRDLRRPLRSTYGSHAKFSILKYQNYGIPVTQVD